MPGNLTFATDQAEIRSDFYDCARLGRARAQRVQEDD
jgi:hypothetical protein